LSGRWSIQGFQREKQSEKDCGFLEYQEEQILNFLKSREFETREFWSYKDADFSAVLFQYNIGIANDKIL